MISRILFRCLGLAVSGAVLLAYPAGTQAAAAQQPQPPVISLKILYAGHPASAREKDFVQFLSRHFSQVKTGDLATFTPRSADGFDVVLLDYDAEGADANKAPRPKLPPEYTKPTVTIGMVGGMICSFRGLKCGYW
jgi:hypothetical protein